MLGRGSRDAFPRMPACDCVPGAAAFGLGAGVSRCEARIVRVLPAHLLLGGLCWREPMELRPGRGVPHLLRVRVTYPGASHPADRHPGDGRDEPEARHVPGAGRGGPHAGPRLLRGSARPEFPRRRGTPSDMDVLSNVAPVRPSFGRATSAARGDPSDCGTETTSGTLARWRTGQ